MQENLKYQAYELVKEKVELKGILDSVDEFNEKIKEFEDELDKKLRELFGVVFEAEED